MEAKDKIIALRKEYDLTQKELGDIAGVSSAAVSAWELGIRSPKIGYLRNICNHFKIDVHYFIEDENTSLELLPKNIIPLEPMKKIPLVGRIACGTPILAEQNIEDYIDLPRHIRADFALLCEGESMINAGIQEGDMVYIRKQEEVENGEIAAVMVGDDEATLKRYYFQDGIIQLVAENPGLAPLVFIGEEMNKVRVIGRAIAYTRIIK